MIRKHWLLILTLVGLILVLSNKWIYYREKDYSLAPEVKHIIISRENVNVMISNDSSWLKPVKE